MVNVHGVPHSPFGAGQNNPFEQMDGSPNWQPVGSVGLSDVYDEVDDIWDYFDYRESPDYYDEFYWRHAEPEVNPYARHGAAFVVGAALVRDAPEPKKDTPVEEPLAELPLPGRHTNGFGGRSKTPDDRGSRISLEHPILDMRAEVSNEIEADIARRLEDNDLGIVNTRMVDDRGQEFTLRRYGWDVKPEEIQAERDEILADAARRRASIHDEALRRMRFARAAHTRPTPAELQAAAERLRADNERRNREARAAREAKKLVPSTDDMPIDPSLTSPYESTLRQTTMAL